MSENKLIKVLVIVLVFLPNFAKAQEQINPFVRPNQTSIYYGSGDVDSSGVVDQTDYDLIQSGISNDLSDIDGDGMPSTSSDLTILKDHLDFGTYLPSDWNKLLTRQEREDWIDKMFAIDKTDTLSGVKCIHFACQTYINFHGFDGTIPTKYDTTNNGRFNLPVYNVFIRNPGHAANIIITGENALYWNDGLPIEPQADRHMQIGDWNLKPGEVWIEKVTSISDNGYHADNFIKFLINSDHTVNLLSYSPNLITHRDSLTTAVDDDKNLPLPKEFNLKQNYPNPFNNSTIIPFEIPQGSEVDLKIYNILGQELADLVDGYHAAGVYKIRFDGSNYPSGIYFYKLNAEGIDETKKLVIVK
ncbi:T9SS type A sorting domain-containing protein [candidate division KSB1 bacterium]